MASTRAPGSRSAVEIAGALQARGLAGARVLLLYPPGLEYIEAFFGCLYAGAIAVPAYPPDPLRLQRSVPRLEAIGRDSVCGAVLTTHAIHQLARAVVDHAPHLQAIPWIASDQLTGQASDWHSPIVDTESVAFLQYTSGSTGQPRGVVLTHGNLIHNQLLIREAFHTYPEARSVSWLPLYHDMGLIGTVLQPIFVGASVCLMSPLAFLQRPVRWLQAITKYRARYSGGPSFAFDLCVRKITPAERRGLDLSSLEVAFCGAEPVRAATLEAFARTFAECGFRREAFHPTYGLAEATLMATGGHA
ncbi:MAG: AMP-binding protein, partial [Myxococcales bacterium]|nr:AMP-binding protein [Myxococcales bacterium]